MSIRIRWKKCGGHIHMRVFVGERPDLTHAKAGELCVREDEWSAFQGSWPGALFLPDD
jgi:hypothetical protein